MEKISAVIITCNEEKNITRCIQSLLPVADEIIISDSYSTDKTSEIAQKLGAKVYTNQFIGYGATKNNAHQYTAFNWILSIDADEELDKELQQSILHVKLLLNNNSAYRVKRLNNYCGKWIKHGGWNPDKKIRLFNKTIVKWNLAEVHETLELPETTQIVELKGKLLHYSYRTIQEHKNKMERYSTRGAEELAKKRKKHSLLKQYASPLVRFIRDYLFRLGFLDGYYGYIIAKYTAIEVSMKYRKLKSLIKQ
ncbi:MAG: glycosyltransferase family 2 protein [Bacteroidia bacterium]|nr:glycosyltransferase family 2 protein [Bacteroidia bacterium]